MRRYNKSFIATIYIYSVPLYEDVSRDSAYISNASASIMNETAVDQTSGASSNLGTTTPNQFSMAELVTGGDYVYSFKSFVERVEAVGELLRLPTSSDFPLTAEELTCLLRRLPNPAYLPLFNPHF